jgi:hypothetical protein
LTHIEVAAIFQFLLEKNHREFLPGGEHRERPFRLGKFKVALVCDFVGLDIIADGFSADSRNEDDFRAQLAPFFGVDVV